jgi:cyclic pyranopterin phosphate synthase
MLSHFDDAGASRMVNVGQKPLSERIARASARVRMQKTTLELVCDSRASKKGDVLEVARLAGIMAAKRTGELIPLCHTLALDSVTIDFVAVPPAPLVPEESRLEGPADCFRMEECAVDEKTVLTIEAAVRCTGRTGVEMEALTAVAVAALTVYDMCKSIDRGMVIEQIQLEEKSGGRSGHFLRES